MRFPAKGRRAKLSAQQQPAFTSGGAGAVGGVVDATNGDGANDREAEGAEEVEGEEKAAPRPQSG